MVVTTTIRITGGQLCTERWWEMIGVFRSLTTTNPDLLDALSTKSYGLSGNDMLKSFASGLSLVMVGYLKLLRSGELFHENT